jgi:hypothetical protein
MLNIMTLAYRGMPAETFASNQLGTIATRREQLFNTYVQQMFQRAARTKNELYSSKRARKWMGWLAYNMTKHQRSIFYLEELHRSWLMFTNPKIWQLQTIIVGLAVGLYFSISVGSVLGISVGSVIFGLFVGLLAAPIVWFFYVLAANITERFEIPEQPVEGSITWSWKSAWEGVKLHKYQLSLVLVVGLFSGLLLALLSELGFWYILMLVMISGMVSTIFVGLFFGFRAGLRDTELEIRISPNQGSAQSFKHAVVSGFGLGIILGLFSSLVVGSDGGLIIGLSMFWIGLLDGGSSLVNHYTIRLVLCANGYMPWNYVRFLDYAAERIFLRKVGGGYIFVHRLLMEHFAAMYPVSENSR